MTWREVFDSYKLNYGFSNIYDVNKFLHTHTTFDFFAFNGIIFKVMHPKQFDYEKSKTNIKVTDLE